MRIRWPRDGGSKSKILMSFSPTDNKDCDILKFQSFFNFFELLKVHIVLISQKKKVKKFSGYQVLF